MVIAVWAGWWGGGFSGFRGPGKAQRPAGLRRGAFMHRRARYPGSRGAGPCQSSRRCWRAKAGCRERASIERAEGMDAHSERPARWHGRAPKPARGGALSRRCDAGAWLVVVVVWAGWWRAVARASGDRDGPTTRRSAGLRRGAFIAPTCAVYGFARGRFAQSQMCSRPSSMSGIFLARTRRIRSSV